MRAAKGKGRAASRDERDGVRSLQAGGPIRNPKSKIQNPSSVFSLRDLLRGLFPLSTEDAPEDCDYAAAIEHRYSSPRRCC